MRRPGPATRPAICASSANTLLLHVGSRLNSESSSVSLTFGASGGRARHAGIGERLRVDPDDLVTVRLEVTGAPGCTAHFVTDQGTLFTTPLPPSGTGTAQWRTTPAYATYVRAEVRHAPVVPGLPGPPAALTNPVFLGN